MADGGKVIVKIDGDDSSFKKAMGGLGNVGKTALKGIAVGAAAVTTGIAAIGKSAISAYADYEQLVGGVETLFGAGGKSIEEYAAKIGQSVDEARGSYDKLMASQQTVLDNANKAFQTAGLSANQYMETVTSFSASLLQSVGGDTQKAADMANTAVIDMSDNANKMGTDIQRIQDAYQGFAKQNYTMLDNLKLGYGGTKTEMERLLKTANEINAQQGIFTDYSIDSFADITEAIHVIQTEMGITGTTAEEAASTIQGSLAMTKAAWENLMTGLTDPDQDLSVLIDNLLSSVTTLGENLMPRIQQVLGGIGTVITELAPPLMQAITDIVPQLLPSVVEGVVELTNALVGALPMLVDAIVNSLPAFMAGISQVMEGIISALPELVATIVSALPELIPQFIEGMTGLITAICEQLPEIIQPIIDALPDIIVSIVEALIENLPVLIAGLIQLTIGIIAALPQILAGLGEALVTIFTDLFSKAWEAIKNVFANVDEYFGTNFSGALEAIEAIWDTAVDYFTMIWENIQAVFSVVVTFFEGMFSTAWEAIKAVWDTVTGYFQAIWDTIAAIFGVVADVLTGDFEGAWEGIKSIVDIWADYFRSVWENIKGVFSAVGSWFSSTFRAAYNAITNIWNNVTSFFSGIWEKIKAVFKPSEFTSIGSNIVHGLWNGISGAAGWLYGQVANFAKGILDKAKAALGIHSPSTFFRDQVGAMIDKGIAVGIDKNASEVEKALDSMNETMLESEFVYLVEKQRLEDEAAAQALQKKYDDAEKELKQAKEKAKDAAEIQEAEAKYAEKIEQIKQDEINDTQKKEQDAYLKRLKDTADREKKIYEARQKDIENAKEEIKDAFQDLADAAFDSIEEIEKSQTSLADKLKDFGELYTTKTGKYANGKEFEIVKLADIEKQTKALEDYADKLQAVKERGDVPQEFFATLRDLSVEEGTKFADALLKADDKAFNKYIEDWKTKQETADEISKLLYADEAQQAKDEIESSFNEFDADLNRKGAENAKAWGDAFIAGIKETMPKVMAQINYAFSNLVNTPSFAVSGGGGTVNNYTTYTEKAPQRIETTVSLNGREFGRSVYTAYQDESKRLGK